MKTDAFERVGAVFVCFDIFHSLIVAADIVIYIINGNLLKKAAVTANLSAMYTVHNTTIK